jgi:glycine oxidase
VAVPRSTPEHVVIDCRGLAARDVLSDLRGVKGEMLLLRQPELSLSRPVRVLHPRVPVYVVPRGGGLFMVGATMIESDEARRVTARSVLELLSAVYALHPAFGEAEVVEIGGGVRPAFPDNLPRVRWRDGILHVNGFYRHGFLLAPALARQATAEVMDEDHPQRRRA